MFCGFQAFLSVHCSLVVTSWEMASLLTLLYVFFYLYFFDFPMWCHLIVSIPDLCLLTYFDSFSIGNLIVSHSKRLDSVLVRALVVFGQSALIVFW